MVPIILALAAGGVALVFAAATAARVLMAYKGNEQIQAIGDAIREGDGRGKALRARPPGFGLVA